MAYEEKRHQDEGLDLEPILKFIRIILAKWWLVMIFILAFSIAGFGIAHITYDESYTSSIIFNVSNKLDAGEDFNKYNTASDMQASATIASNFKYIVENGVDFASRVADTVKATSGKDISYEDIQRMLNVELVSDSTLVRISVKSDDKDLTYDVTTAIQSVYSAFAKDAFPTANISVADSATASKLAADSSKLIYTAAGFLLGAALAVLIILIRARIQNKLLSTEDIKNKFNIDIIATVSDIKSKNKKGDRSRLLITDRNVGLPFIETFKLIRTKLENAKLKKGFSVFAITSSTESEGKTTCSSNIALSLAKSGKSVLLIDADLRKPAVCKTLGIAIEGEKGIYDIVHGNKTFEESVKYIEKYNLYLLVCSAAVADPSETLASDQMAKLVEQARKEFDYVIIDCPPAGVVADAAIVANYTDTIIFVTAEERVAIPQIEYALSDVMTTKADVMGCIYNRAGTGTLKVAAEKSGGYFSNRYGGYYGSSYYYGSRHHKRRK